MNPTKSLYLFKYPEGIQWEKLFCKDRPFTCYSDNQLRYHINDFFLEQLLKMMATMKIFIFGLLLALVSSRHTKAKPAIWQLDQSSKSTDDDHSYIQSR